jgi:two-component system response regulator AtoC
MYRLIINAGTPHEKAVTLDKAAYRVGRNRNADIVLSNKNFSGLHFSLLLSSEKAEIVDLDSTNGTMVNGKKITRAVLADNDLITVADTNIRFSAAMPPQLSLMKTALYPLEDNHDNAEEERILTTLRDTGTLSVRNAETITTKMAQYRRDGALFEILYRLLQRTMPLTDREAILALLLEEIITLLNLEIAGIYLVAEEHFFILTNGRLVVENSDAVLSTSVLHRVLDSKCPVVLEQIGSDMNVAGFQSLLRFNIKSCLCFPILNRERNPLGAFYCVSTKTDRLKLLESDRRFLDICSTFIALILENIGLIESEKGRAYKAAALREQAKFSPIINRLQQEKENLSLKLGGAIPVPSFFGLDQSAHAGIHAFVDKAARTGLPVLITGETGTGKSLLAREIHAAAHHRGPFVTIDCTTIPAELLESELFGHEKGAFTGAHAKRPGKVAAAQNGTLFIDEIAELTPGLQAKLLRFIQSGEFEPLGASQTLRSNAKLITATNRDIQNQVALKQFREDLYYRLNILHIDLPPLRMRTPTIIPLAGHFLRQYAPRLNPVVGGFSPNAERVIANHAWPGNVRELENAVMRALVNAAGDRIEPEHLALAQHSIPGVETGAAVVDESESLDLKMARERIDRILITRALAATGYNMSQAAKLLNLSRNSLMDLVKKYALRSE